MQGGDWAPKLGAWKADGRVVDCNERVEILQRQMRNPLLFCLFSCKGCLSLPMGSGVTATCL